MRIAIMASISDPLKTGTETGRPSLANNRSRKVILSALIVSWALAVVLGMSGLWRYALTPGLTGQSLVRWPADLPIGRSLIGPTLVMMVHPQCPCSRASVDELALLMARCKGKLTATVLFPTAKGFDGPVQPGVLWQSASEIPGVTVLVDRDAVMTRRFGGQTSGQVLLFDSQGLLQFSGGLTAARGHEGDNDGLTAITAIVESQKPTVRRTPVFGCKIW